MVKTKDKFLFLSFQSPDYSRSGVYLSGADPKNVTYQNVKHGLRNSIAHLRSIARDESFKHHKIVIMSPSHILAVLSRLFLKNSTILDAGWSLTESSVAHLPSPKAFFQMPKNLAVDFLAFHLSNLVIVETPQQLKYINKYFFVPRKKMYSIYTGLNEIAFGRNQYSNLVPQKKFKVLFRGKFNNEAGLGVIAEVTRLLEDDNISFHIQTNDEMKGMVFSTHTTVNSNYLTYPQIADLYRNSHLSLGQFSKRSRLKRTIPHKAFESLYFGRCYLSPRTQPLSQLVRNGNEIVLLDDISPQAIANKIRSLAVNYIDVERIGLLGNELYRESLSQEILARHFFDACGTLDRT